MPLQGGAGGGDEIGQGVGEAELDVILIHDFARPGTGIGREHETLTVHPEHPDSDMLHAFGAGRRPGKGGTVLLIEGI